MAVSCISHCSCYVSFIVKTHRLCGSASQSMLKTSGGRGGDPGLLQMASFMRWRWRLSSHSNGREMRRVCTGVDGGLQLYAGVLDIFRFPRNSPCKNSVNGIPEEVESPQS